MICACSRSAMEYVVRMGFERETSGQICLSVHFLSRFDTTVTAFSEPFDILIDFFYRI